MSFVAIYQLLSKTSRPIICKSVKGQKPIPPCAAFSCQFSTNNSPIIRESHHSGHTRHLLNFYSGCRQRGFSTDPGENEATDAPPVQPAALKKSSSKKKKKRKQSWNDQYRSLLKYKESHKKSSIVTIKNNQNLNIWGREQRNMYAMGELSEERVKKLEDIGFEWNLYDAKWQQRFLEVLDYKRKHGHCDVPIKHDETNLKLGRWVRLQRKQYKHLTHGHPKPYMSQQRVESLERIGFKWDIREERWIKMFEEFRRHQEKNGDGTVTKSARKELYSWTKLQRNHYSRMKDDQVTTMSPWKIKLLNEAGFLWDSNVEKECKQWIGMFQELMKYKDLFGNCLVPTNYGLNPKLSCWVKNQRKMFSLSMLSEDQVKDLSDSGFVWEVEEKTWEEMLNELHNFKKQNGHCIVPQFYPSNPELADWVIMQRYEYQLQQEGSESSLTDAKIQALENEQFNWDEEQIRWNILHTELSNFKKIYGHCNVPLWFPSNPALGNWVRKQRNLFDLARKSKDNNEPSKLTTKQLDMLEEFDF